MATSRQIAANRANSQKSTGPKTPEGKAKCSLNATSHGFTASALFLEHEDREAFAALLSDLVGEFQPATPTEQILVEKMVLSQWNSLRAIRLQTLELGCCFRGIPKDLGLLIRYQTASDRAFHKAHAELLKAQKERKNSEIGSVSPVLEEVFACPANSDETPAPEAVVQPEKPVDQPEICIPPQEVAPGDRELPQAA
jgi:hypothetical protein